MIEGDAAQVDKYLAERGLSQVDHVRVRPADAVVPERRAAGHHGDGRQGAKPGTAFRQLTAMPYVYWRFYKKYFRDVQFQLVPWNLPPAGYYLCRGFHAP